MTGLILFAHGSTVVAANEAVQQVAMNLEHRMGHPVETAFLECSPPTMAEAFSKLIERKVQRVIVVPYFLTMGIHLKRDLPRIVQEIRGGAENIYIEIADPMDGHPALLDILVDRSAKALTRRHESESSAD